MGVSGAFAGTKKTSRILIVYMFFFYAIWTAFELIVKNRLDDAIQNTVLCAFVKSGIIKNCVWTLPAMLLIQRYKTDVYIPLKEMFSTKINWRKYAPVFLAFTVYVLAGAVLHHGRPGIVPGFGAEEIIIVLFVGLTEETVFRGWLLNVTFSENRRWPCLLVNSAMFLAIHFPKWIASGTLLAAFTSLQFLEIAALSVVFGLAFLRSKNILVPIALHMYYDLLVFMLI